MACSEEWWAEEDSEDDCAESERLRKAAAAATVRRRVVADLLPFLCHDGRGPQGKKRRREGTPFSWDAHLLLLTEEEFKRRYRLDFDRFNVLLGKCNFYFK